MRGKVADTYVNGVIGIGSIKTLDELANYVLWLLHDHRISLCVAGRCKFNSIHSCAVACAVYDDCQSSIFILLNTTAC